MKEKLELGQLRERGKDKGVSTGEGSKKTGHKSIETESSLIPTLIQQLVFRGESHFTIRPHCAILNKKPTFHYQGPTLALLCLSDSISDVWQLLEIELKTMLRFY